MAKTPIFVILGLLCLANLGQSSDPAQNAQELLENFIPKDYSKVIRPNYAGAPVQVNVTMYIIQLSDVSDKHMEFKSSMYFRQKWTDPRLAFSPENYGGQDTIQGSEKLAEKLWRPDTFFANVKSLKFHKNILQDGDNQFVRIKSNGEVFMSKMVELTTSCPMNLQYFPFDRQVCSIEMESYGYSMSDIVYAFGEKSVGISGDAQTTNFKILDTKQDVKIVSLSTGNYSQLVMEIELQRNPGSFINRVFIPAFLLVLLSWIPLFLTGQTRGHHFARVALSTAILLGMFVLTAIYMRRLSHVNVHSPLHCYLLSSLVASGLVVLVTVVVTVLSRSDSKYKSFRTGSEGDVSQGLNVVDKWARWIVPAIWLVYNVVFLVRVW